MKKYMAVLLVLSFPAWGKGSDEIDTFSEAKKVAAKIHKGHETTIYCGCKYSKTFSSTLKVVAAGASKRQGAGGDDDTKGA